MRKIESVLEVLDGRSEGARVWKAGRRRERRRVMCGGVAGCCTPFATGDGTGTMLLLDSVCHLVSHPNATQRSCVVILDPAVCGRILRDLQIEPVNIVELIAAEIVRMHSLDMPGAKDSPQLWEVGRVKSRCQVDGAIVAPCGPYDCVDRRQPH